MEYQIRKICILYVNKIEGHRRGAWNRFKITGRDELRAGQQAGFLVGRKPRPLPLMENWKDRTYAKGSIKNSKTSAFFLQVQDMRMYVSEQFSTHHWLFTSYNPPTTPRFLVLVSPDAEFIVRFQKAHQHFPPFWTSFPRIKCHQTPTNPVKHA
jgi:hypothetical protein